MKQWRALWIASALWAFLGWMYVITRIFVNGSDVWWQEEFIAGIPVAFWMLGVGWYIIGFIATWRALCGESP